MLALAALLRPLGSLLFFGLAALVAYTLKPLIPSGRMRDLLYDRTIRTNHPWKFALLALFSCYGMAGLIAYLVL
jgi:hypothetical protein